jgi:hypothetical protein
MNCKNGTFIFKEGDVIEMDFDTTAMALRLRCNEQQNSFAVVPP